jgi:hypothetical protein
MPSLILVLCSMPKAQKDTSGFEESTKAKQCANNVTPLCPVLLSSSLGKLLSSSP